MPAVVGSQQPQQQHQEEEVQQQQQQQIPGNPSPSLNLRRELPLGLPGFIVKLWSLVNDAATDPIISWDSSGDAILISDGNALAAEVLPMYFKHNNLASFTRQLNMYGFHKLVASDSSGQMHFQHPYFQRGRVDLLGSVNRHMAGSLGGGRYSLALASRPSAEAAGFVEPSGSAEPTRSTSAGEAAVPFNSRDAVQAALTEMRSRQAATDQQLRRLCDENHKLWLELDNLRVQHQQQQVAVSWLLDFIKAAMVNRAAGGAGCGPRISEPELHSPRSADGGPANLSADASTVPSTSSAAAPAGASTSGFGVASRKRSYPFPTQQQLMAIEMPPVPAAIEAAKQRPAITHLPATPPPPPPPPVSTSASESPSIVDFCPEAFTADINSRQADLDGIVNALEIDESLDFDVDRLLSELVQSPQQQQQPAPGSQAAPPSLDPIGDEARDPNNLDCILEPLLTSNSSSDGQNSIQNPPVIE